MPDSVVLTSLASAPWERLPDIGEIATPVGLCTNGDGNALATKVFRLRGKLT
jgi:hypothetical protein